MRPLWHGAFIYSGLFLNNGYHVGFSSSAAFNLFLALTLQFGCGILNNFIPKVENNIYLIIYSFIGI